jgi:hypothetical protein
MKDVELKKENASGSSGIGRKSMVKWFSDQIVLLHCGQYTVLFLNNVLAILSPMWHNYGSS